VTPAGEHEHWLDRLAERHTRRGALKGALAAAALTLPLARSVSAVAAASRTLGCPGQVDSTQLNKNPFAWKTGCEIDANRRYEATESICIGQFGHSSAVATAVFGALAKYAPALVPGEVSNQVALQRCVDGALLQRTTRLRNCVLPYAPGFNPCAKGGPCETCPGICCPGPCDSGFCCCPAAPLGCCKQDGCHNTQAECAGG
jgi:hypothetical protein